jgi:hypothetical protein
MNTVQSVDTSLSRTSGSPVLGYAQSPNSGERLPAMADETMASALPKLPDDALVGVEVDHIVIRDAQADLKFRGTLIASAAPERYIDGRWRELRVYVTKGGKKVFSEIGRSVWDNERDKFKTVVFDPLKIEVTFPGDPIDEAATLEARSIAEKEALTRFFGFSDLAKKLYAKLGAETEDFID